MHTVKSGETLWHISRQYSTTIDAIVKANNLANPNLIRVGQRLIIPGQSVPGTPVPSAPAAKPLQGTPFTHRTFTNSYNGRPARIHVVKFPVDRVQATVLYPGAGPPFRNRTVSSMAREWGADLAVNASFFYGGYPLGRHIRSGGRVYDYPADKPTIILDDWRLDTWYDGVQRLLKGGTQNCLSSYPYLLYRGDREISKCPSGLATLHPRTAMALSKDKKTFIVAVVDGRLPGHSLGVTLRELQAILVAEGAWEWALNLDGGGSTAMWFRGKIINRPCYGERAVVNALAFKVKQ